jgi:hypothetical protein
MLRHMLDVATHVSHALNIFINAVLVFCFLPELF